MLCKYCGNKMPDDAKFCENCGGQNEIEEKTTVDLDKSQQTYYENQFESDTSTTSGSPQQNYNYGSNNNQNYYYTGSDDYENPQAKNEATKAMIFGIIALVFCWCSPVGIVLGVLAITSADKASKLGCNSGMQKAGKITGIIGISLSSLSLFGSFFNFNFNIGF